MKKIILIVLLVLVLGAGGLFGYTMIKAGEEGRFLNGTTLNGENVSGMNAQEAAGTLTGPYADTRVEVVEHDKVTLSLSLADAGYLPNEEKALKSMRHWQRSQLFPMPL